MRKVWKNKSGPSQHDSFSRSGVLLSWSRRNEEILLPHVLLLSSLFLSLALVCSCSRGSSQLSVPLYSLPKTPSVAKTSFTMRKLQHAATIAGLLQFQHLACSPISEEQSFAASWRVTRKLNPSTSLIPASYPQGDQMSSPGFTLVCL